MAQISLYVEDKILRMIQTAAKREKQSVSKWVSKRIEGLLVSKWPDGYFNCFGSIKDDTFRRHDQGRFSDDVRRVKL